MTQVVSWLGFAPGDLRAPLIGRVAEMHELEKAHESLRLRREPRIVTVLGAPGVGKTRLVHDFLAKLRGVKDQSLRIFRGTARDTHESYGIFAQILRSRFGLVQGMSDEEAKTQIRAQVASVLEDRKVGDVVYYLGQLLDLSFGRSPLTNAVAGDAVQSRLLRCTVFKSFLAADAQKGPLCFVFEDLHAAHEDSIHLLRYLLANFSGPILAICVARNELLSRHEDWGRLGGAAHRVVEIGPLGELDAATLMEALLAPCGEPPQALVEAACQLAGGNPLLLEQMVRIFHDTGVLEEEDALAESPVWLVHLDKLSTVRLPLTVEDAVQARIGALAPAERELLERAAAIGSVFWLGALVVLRRLDREPPEFWLASDESDQRQIRSLLEELRERDYVLKLPDSTFPGDEEYVFKHNLERERISQLRSVSTSRLYHEVIADWLGYQSNVRSHEEYLAMLARHRERAGAQVQAALAYLDAGDVARERYASAKAQDHYHRGLELLGNANPQRRMDACHHLGDVLQQMGKSDEALDAFRQMLRVAYRLNLKAKGGAAHNRIGRLYRDQGLLDEAGQHLSTGLALFEVVGDERGVASSLDDLGNLHWLRGDHAKAIEPLRTALAMRERIGHRRSIAVSLNNLGLALQDSGDLQQALGVFGQALELRREIGDLVGVVITLNNLGMLAQAQGDHERALATFQEALGVAREIGDRNRIAMLLTNMGEAHHALGRASEAIRKLKEAEEIADELGDRIGLGDALRRLGSAYLQQGEIVRARDCISRATEIFSAARCKVRLGGALRALGEVTAVGGWGPEHARKARDYLVESIKIFEEVRNEIELAKSLRACATFLAKTQELGDVVGLEETASEMNHRADEIDMKLAVRSSGKR